MRMGWIAALALGLAAPAFANRGDTAKDAQDSMKNTGDDVKDALHTDSGHHKAKRHAQRQGRDAKKDLRQKKNRAKEKLGLDR